MSHPKRKVKVETFGLADIRASPSSASTSRNLRSPREYSGSERDDQNGNSQGKRLRFPTLVGREVFGPSDAGLGEKWKKIGTAPKDSVVPSHFVVPIPSHSRSVVPSHSRSVVPSHSRSVVPPTRLVVPSHSVVPSQSRSVVPRYRELPEGQSAVLTPLAVKDVPFKKLAVKATATNNPIIKGTMATSSKGPSEKAVTIPVVHGKKADVIVGGETLETFRKMETGYNDYEEPYLGLIDDYQEPYMGLIDLSSTLGGSEKYRTTNLYDNFSLKSNKIPIQEVKLSKGTVLRSKRNSIREVLPPEESVPIQEVIPPEESVLIKTRAYQQEMFQESLKRNIIVCQATGSGKTHIAILRIRHEIEHGPPHRMCWFLVPNKPLADQQYRALEAQLPPVPIKLLSGNDGTEKWDSDIWDEVLGLGDIDKRVKVAVSTHQILLDALAHGFVSIDELGLIVFDEAHHCIGDNPANVMMREFYHPRLQTQEYVPAILGLTASPLFNGNAKQLHVIETNLNAICRTPKHSRTLLHAHSHLPTLRVVSYASVDGAVTTRPSKSLPYVIEAYDNMDEEDDPILSTLPRETEQDEYNYQKALKSGTYTMQQMKSLKNKCEHVNSEYGGWACDFYINMVVNTFTDIVRKRSDELIGWKNEEKAYLSDILSKVRTYDTTDRALVEKGALSPMVEKLIDVLVEEYEADLAKEENRFSGIIFVEQRVGVAVLAEIFSRHPKTKGILKCGTLVGTSQNAAKMGKNIAELVDPNKTNTTLADFRTGVKNLIIATSVAEEGLDIQSCHLVVCCYVQKNKKSYVQMRGRARRKGSTYVLMFQDEWIGRAEVEKSNQWEQEMLAAYQDEERELREQEEEVESEEEEMAEEKYYIEETKALLTYGRAIPHLHHFCSVIPHSQYIDVRPEFLTRQLVDERNLWTAELTLPSCIPPELRKFTAKYLWKSEKVAKRDVAFQAYVALHKNGLVDDHLLPFPTVDQDAEMDDIAKKTSTEEVPEQMDPFEKSWELNERGEVKVFISGLNIKWDNGEMIRLKMILPFACPKMGNFDLWWTNSESVQVTVKHRDIPTYWTQTQFKKAQEDTYILLSTVFQGQLEKDRFDFSYLFTLEDGNVPFERIPATDVWQAWNGESSKSRIGIVRDKSQQGRLYIFKAWNHEAVIEQEEMEKRYPDHERIPELPLLEVNSVPRRRNFLQRYMHTLKEEEEEEERASIRDTKSVFLLPQVATFDPVPWSVERSVLLIPCILRKLEIYAVAKELQETVMAPIGFNSLEDIITAITASSAAEETNYQRYELLGDSVLKFLAGLQLLADYPLWHEGYLSGKKDRSVANSKLTQESMRLKMSRFIITNVFSPQKWRARYLSKGDEEDVAPEEEKQKRELSSKILADVVESLMGAAYLEGSFNKALEVAKVFGLDMKWDTLENRVTTLYDRAITPQGMHFPTYLHHLETLLGYTFKKKALLLEAITHPSHTSDSTFVSYQRMEFLGDSVLDMAIVDRLFRHEKNFSHVVHLYKSASVNEYFLGFLCLNLSMTVENAEKEVHTDWRTGKVTLSSKEKQYPLFRFLRHNNHEVTKMQDSAHTNYVALKSDIFQALRHGKDFPWTLLAAINAEKFFSDLVESILGAIFIDSHGSFDAVNAAIDKLGIFKILDRLLEDGVDPIQPVQKLGIFAAQKMQQSTTKYVQGVEGGEYFCEVMINEELVTKVVGGVSKAEVQIRAAEEAYNLCVDRVGMEKLAEPIREWEDETMVDMEEEKEMIQEGICEEKETGEKVRHAVRYEMEFEMESSHDSGVVDLEDSDSSVYLSMSEGDEDSDMDLS